MEITYDEYIVSWQNGEARNRLDSKISDEAERRYEARFLDCEKNIEVKKNFGDVSKKEYKNLRRNQMAKLFNFYTETFEEKDLSKDNNVVLLTKPIEVLELFEERAEYKRENSLLALDQNSI